MTQTEIVNAVITNRRANYVDICYWETEYSKAICTDKVICISKDTTELFGIGTINNESIIFINKSEDLTLKYHLRNEYLHNQVISKVLY